MQWLRPPVTGAAPVARMHHSMEGFNGRLVIFGGCNAEDERLSDIAIVDLDSMRWVSVTATGTVPKARDSHAAVVVCSYKLQLCTEINR